MTARYIAVLLEEPAVEEVQWLAAAAGTQAALIVAELRWLHRVVGLLVAERDALDDQTAADVSHALDALAADKGRDSSGAGARWQQVRREYFDAMAMRGGAGSPLARLAAVLLRRSGVTGPTEAQLVRALELVTRFRHRANQALQEAYGATALPEDQLPSAVWRERTGQGKAV